MLEQKKLRKLQLVELEILKEIRSICEKYSLEYYLIGGTLLGAVRHQGFIPWDDDLDIVMPREDYEKFIKICEKNLNSDYYLESYRNDNNYWIPFAKMRKNNTLFVEEDTKHMVSHKGIFVDIFPLDYSDNDIGFSLIFKGKVFSYLRYLIGDKLGLYDYKNFDKSPFRDRIVKYLLLPFSANYMLQFQQWFIQRGGKKKRYFVNYGSQYGIEKQTIAVEKFRPAVKVKFENDLFSAPNDYKFILNRIYGSDYMSLPPEDKRISHSPVKVSFDIASEQQ